MSTPTVSVVIPHFYEERTANLIPIINALRGGTIQPKEILIWNNTQTIIGDLLSDRPYVEVIDCPFNMGAQARFLAALMASGDLILFQDNDLHVESLTIAWMIEHHLPGQIITLEGVQQVFGRAYRRWNKVYGRGLLEPMQVGISLGRVEMVARAGLPEILATFPFDRASTVMDDLEFSAAARTAGYVIQVIPTVRGVSDLVEFDTRGVGMATGPDAASYYTARDLVAQRLFG